MNDRRIQTSRSIMETPAVAKAKSLVKWINSFGVSDVNSLEDLSSGHLLLCCLQKVIPQLCENLGEPEPWGTLLKVLEGFYNCSLKESISLSEVQGKNEEHIARAIVLLLCLAVQQQPNEDVISQITSLDTDTQQDMMFFIEDTTAKVNSHTIVRGTFTSGIGEPLLRLDGDHSQALPVQLPGSPKPPPVSCRPPSTPLLSRGRRKGLCIPSTPQSSCKQRVACYSGLESPAAVKWLTSPAIARSASRTSMCIPSEDNCQSAEVAKLQHRIRILQKALDNESRLCTEFYTDLCQKTAEYSSLESKYLRRESMLERLEELQDTKDELDQKTANLLKAEKALARYKHEVELLSGYKEQTQVLEAKMCGYSANEAKLQESQQELDHVSTALIEKAAKLKRVELLHQTAVVEVQARTCELEDVIQQNKELSRVQRKLEEEKRELASEVESAKADLLTRDSSLTLLEQECQKLRAELEDNKVAFESQIRSLKEELQLLQEKKISLEASLLVRDSAVASLEQECQKLREKLELGKVDFERLVGGLKEELLQMQEQKTDLETDLAVKESALVQQNRKTSEELERTRETLDQVREELKQAQEERNSIEADLLIRASAVTALEEECQKLREELNGTNMNFVSQVEGLKEEVQQLQEEKSSLEADLLARDFTISSLEQECQKLMGELESSKGKYESLVGGLKEELQLMQDKKISLEADVALKTSLLVEQSAELEKVKETSHRELERMTEKLKLVQDQKNNIEADLLVRDSTLASLEQEYQKLREEFNGSTVNFEKQVGGLKEELQLLREKKISLEAHLLVKDSTVVSLEQECQKLREEKESSRNNFERQVGGLKEKLQLVEEQKINLQVKYQCELETQRQCEASLMQEKATVKAFREHLRQLQEQHADIDGQVLAEKQQLREELNQAIKLLVKEQQNCSKLTTENKSLEAQLSFASQKLRDFERTKSNQSSPPHLCRQSSRFRYSQAPSNCSYNPRMSEEAFQSQLQREFDDSASTSTLPFELQEPPCEEEDSFLEDVLSYPNPMKRVTTTVPPSSSTSRSSVSHNGLPIIYEDADETSSNKDDDKTRIGELQRRNAKALPHLKSSYPIELQVQPESPSVSDEQVKNGLKTDQPSQLHAKTTLRQTFTAFRVPLDPSQTRKRNISSRKRDGEFIPPVDVLIRSPILSRRRISAPPTPETSIDRPQNSTAESRRFSMACNLREFLDDDEQNCPDSLNPRRESTAFEIAFSPPKAKGLPKRLQVNAPRAAIKTSLQPKPTVTKSKGKPFSRVRRQPLKSKN